MKFTPQIDVLDDRALASVTLSNGLLHVVGTNGADHVSVTRPSATIIRVAIDTTGETRQFALAAVKSILVQGLDGNDNIALGSNITIAAKLQGLGGNDTLRGGGGNDILQGGIGNDMLVGANGNDSLAGVDGNDYLVGQAGNDYLNGMEGSDLLLGGAGTNTYVSGTNLDAQFFNAPLPGGFGTASLFNNITTTPFNKTLIISAAGIPNVSANIFIGSTYIGHLATNSAGAGQFVYRVNYDTNNNRRPDILEGAQTTPIPELAPGTVIKVVVSSPIQTTMSFTVAQLLAQAGV